MVEEKNEDKKLWIELASVSPLKEVSQVAAIGVARSRSPSSTAGRTSNAVHKISARQ